MKFQSTLRYEKLQNLIGNLQSSIDLSQVIKGMSDYIRHAILASKKPFYMGICQNVKNFCKAHPVLILNKLVAKSSKPKVAKRILYFNQSKSLYDGLRTKRPFIYTLVIDMETENRVAL